VLAGEPNVGKSSLINALSDENIAIVSDIAGTTRDSIRSNLHLDGIPITVTDTAGLRFTGDAVEQLGIERTLAAIKSSNVILDIVDIRQPISVLTNFSPSISLTNKNVISVFNKVDLLETTSGFLPKNNCVKVSAVTGEGISELKETLLRLTGRQLGERSPWLARKRHVMAIEQGLDHLKASYAFACQDDKVLDLLAEELRLCHVQIGSITGQMSADDLLGQIFSAFCIGK
jgi:tRNA modification GTPase